MHAHINAYIQETNRKREAGSKPRKKKTRSGKPVRCQRNCKEAQGQQSSAMCNEGSRKSRKLYEKDIQG